jgi:mannose-6-phosphate isomerase
LLRYLATPTRGLWYDTMDVDGRCHDDSAPASSLYHLVTAIAELDRAVAGLTGRR